MKTWKEKAEDSGAIITVEGNRAKVYMPSHKVMAGDEVSRGGGQQAVEACCKAIMQHIEQGEAMSVKLTWENRYA
jgi:hypothetical protein